jgi:hypothetical protein
LENRAVDPKMNRIFLLVCLLQAVLAQEAEEIYLLQGNCLLCVKKTSLFFDEDVECCSPNLRAEKARWIRKKQSDGTYLLQNKRNKEYLNSGYDDWFDEVELETTDDIKDEDVYWNFTELDQGWQIENRNHADRERFLNKDDLERKPGVWKIGRAISNDVNWDEGKKSHPKKKIEKVTPRWTTTTPNTKRSTKMSRKTTTNSTTKQTMKKIPGSPNPMIKPLGVPGVTMNLTSPMNPAGR